MRGEFKSFRMIDLRLLETFKSYNVFRSGSLMQPLKLLLETVYPRINDTSLKDEPHDTDIKFRLP
jgi:hypothetical protein